MPRTLRVVYGTCDKGERPVEATVMAKAGHLHELRDFVPEHAFTPEAPPPG